MGDVLWKDLSKHTSLASPDNSRFSAMKFTSIVALLAAPLAIAATHVSWASYDNPSQSLDTVACSNGPNGLETKGYKTLGDIPNFPNVTGAYVASWNSPNCGSTHLIVLGFMSDANSLYVTGSCWSVTWSGTGVTVTVTVVDGAGDESFNLSEEAMNFLTCVCFP